MRWAIIPEGDLVAEIVTEDPAGRFHPDWRCPPCGTDVRPGWAATETDGVWTFTAPTPPAPPSGPRYVPLATIRARVTEAGNWAAFATALDNLPPEKRWHLLTLAQGVASDDPDAAALLTFIGCDPAAVLAP